MFVVVDEFDGAGNVSPRTIQTDHISTIKQQVIDYSAMCRVCGIAGERVARHDRVWCEENNFPNDYHERVVGKSEEVSVISMYNGETVVAKGQPQLISLV